MFCCSESIGTGSHNRKGLLIKPVLILIWHSKSMQNSGPFLGSFWKFGAIFVRTLVGPGRRSRARNLPLLGTYKMELQGLSARPRTGVGSELFEGPVQRKP